MSYEITSEEVSDKLCGLCTISLDVCSASSSGNAFAGNDGALECMAAGQGDVAFVKHTTLQEVVDKNPKWNVSDYQHYQYLCKDGTREGRSVGDQEGGGGGGGKKKNTYIKPFSVDKSRYKIKCRSRFEFGTTYSVSQASASLHRVV